MKEISLKDKLESDEIDKLIAYMKPLMTNARDRNIFNADNYQLYFIKLLTSKSIKIQNDVLTEETVKAHGLKSVSAISGIIGTCFMIYNYMGPDTTLKTAAYVAMHKSTMLNRTNTLFSHGYGDDEVEGCLTRQETSLADSVSPIRIPASQIGAAVSRMRKDEPSQGWTPLTDEYINNKTGTLNKKGRDDLNNLYKNNQRFRDNIINFGGDKAGLSNDQIIDKRYKYKTLNTLGKEKLNKFVQSR